MLAGGVVLENLKQKNGTTIVTQTFRRDRLTWLAYLLLAFYGYFLNILGPITPFLKEELKLSYTVSSLHFSAFAVGILAIGLIGHAVIARLGRWTALWIGAFGMSAGAIALVAGQSPVITIGAAFCMGLIGSLILVIVPSLLSEEHGEQRAVALSEANVIASLVATAAPLLVGWFAAQFGGWRLALGLAALTPAVLRVAFRRVVLPPSTSVSSTAAARQRLPLWYWVYWFALCLVVSVEFCMISWSADYAENVLGLAKVNAAQAVSLFLAGMIIGRLAGSRLVQRFAAQRVISGSIVVAVVGFLLFWRSGNVALGLAGLFITGLGVASLYPLILSLAIGTTADTIQASARATLASGTAILALPLVLGRLADSAGIQQAYGVVAVLLIGVFAIMLVTGSKTQPATSR
jgi:fucose permease